MGEKEENAQSVDYAEIDADDEDDIDIISETEADEPEFEEIAPRGRSNRKTEVQKKNKKAKKEDRIAVVLAISTVIVAALVALAVYFGVTMSKEASVPDLANMTIEEATAAAQKEGLRIADEIEYSLSDAVAENRVISQDPEPNKIVSKNSEIKLVVSIGSSGGDISTPHVVTKLFEDAVAEILDAGLNYTVQEEDSDTVPAGYIIRQTPLAGTKLNKDDSVNLHVSRGANGEDVQNRTGETVSVPSIIGLGKDQAEATLAANGLSLGNVTRKASSSAEGTVISQSPEFGKNVMKGSYVSIVLSKGSDGAAEGQNQTQNTEPVQPQTNNGGGETGYTSGGDNGEQSSEPSTRTFTVKIPDTANDTVDVEIVVNGQSVHHETHSKEEGTVSVDVKGTGTAEVQAYIDGSKVSDRTINFN